MNKKYIPVVATRDESGHWFIIPKDLIDDFNKNMDEGNYDYIDENYSQYMTGGGLNLVQLYILEG